MALKSGPAASLLNLDILAELQIRVLKAEASLRQKEEENVALQQQLQQYETRWSEYEAKLKSKEDMWQKKMASLQMGLTSPVRSGYDSESVISCEARTPQNTPPRQARASDAGLTRDYGGIPNSVGHLLKEFEQRSQVFEDDVRFLTEVNSGQYAEEELRKLKFRFVAWKKDYKVRLRESKAAAQKLGNSEGEKIRRKWWGKRYSKT